MKTSSAPQLHRRNRDVINSFYRNKWQLSQAHEQSAYTLPTVRNGKSMKFYDNLHWQLSRQLMRQLQTLPSALQRR